MNVEELINLLKQYPPDRQVVLQSYEEGFDPATDVQQIGIVDYPNRQPCYGIYDEDHNSNPNARPAINIFSKRRGEEVERGE